MSKYATRGHHITRCDATTGHGVQIVALCRDVETAQELAHAANCAAVEKVEGPDKYTPEEYARIARAFMLSLNIRGARTSNPSARFFVSHLCRGVFKDKTQQGVGRSLVRLAEALTEQNWHEINKLLDSNIEPE